MQRKDEVKKHGTNPAYRDRPKELLELLNKYACTQRDISEEFNITPGTAYNWVKRLLEEGKIDVKKYNGVFHYYKK